MNVFVLSKRKKYPYGKPRYFGVEIYNNELYLITTIAPSTNPKQLAKLVHKVNNQEKIFKINPKKDYIITNKEMCSTKEYIEFPAEKEQIESFEKELFKLYNNK